MNFTFHFFTRSIAGTAQATLPHHPRPTLSTPYILKWCEKSEKVKKKWKLSTFGPLLWSAVKWSEKLKWSESEPIFGPFNFFNLRYIKGEARGANNIAIKKCTTILIWVLNLEQVGGRQKFFQNLTTGIISKMVSNLSILECIFETKFQGWIFLSSE